jgi:hypothetical protein
MDIHAALARLAEEAKRLTSLPELVDLIYALRKTSELADTARKEMNRIEELTIKQACLIWTTTDGNPIRSDYVTGSPDIKMMASLPRRKSNPEGYAALMRYLGVPDELWDTSDEESEAVRPHFPGMVDLLSRAMQEGRPLPPGISPENTYPLYKMRLVAKKGVDE